MVLNRILDEGRPWLNPLDVCQQDRVSSSRCHTCAFKLMQFKPILLLASLWAIFYLFILRALGACIEWDELLIELFILFVIRVWVLNAVLLVFPYVLERAFVVSALAHVDHFVIWWGQAYLWLLCWTNHYSTCVHHCVVDAGCWVETDARISTHCAKIIQSFTVGYFLRNFWLHLLKVLILSVLVSCLVKGVSFFGQNYGRLGNILSLN